MDNKLIVENVVGWTFLLTLAFWFANRNRHPARRPANAFFVFVGVFGGITLSAIGIVAFLWSEFMPEDTSMPHGVGAILGLAVVIPAWQLAMRLIRRAPSADEAEN
jgi:hypothetical protein